MVDFNYDVENKAYLCPFFIGMPLVVTYLITSLFSSIWFRSCWNGKTPRLAPYWVPVLGHGLSFIWDTGFFGEVTLSRRRCFMETEITSPKRILHHKRNLGCGIETMEGYVSCGIIASSNPSKACGSTV